MRMNFFLNKKQKYKTSNKEGEEVLHQERSIKNRQEEEEGDKGSQKAMVSGHFSARACPSP